LDQEAQRSDSFFERVQMILKLMERHGCLLEMSNERVKI